MLQQDVNPLDDSDNHGIELYERTLDFIYPKTQTYIVECLKLTIIKFDYNYTILSNTMHLPVLFVILEKYEDSR